MNEETVPSHFLQLITPETKPQRLINVKNNMPTISCQLFKNDQQFDNEECQKTQRIKNKNCTQSAEMMQSKDSIEENNLQMSLIQLTTQIDLQKQAINRANQIIFYLKQENQKVNWELNQTKLFYQEQLQQMRVQIKQLQDKIRNQTASTSFVHSRSGKMTPLKVYRKNEEPIQVNYQEQQPYTILGDVHKIMLNKSIIQVQKQLNQLSEITEKQNQNLESIKKQQKYMKNYIQDEVFSLNEYKKSFIKPSDLKLLTKIYEDQIFKWRDYATSLQKDLIICINCINSISIQKAKKSKQKQINFSKMLNDVCQQICEQFVQTTKSLKQQIRQLKQILDELTQKIKKKGWRL